MQAFLVIIRVSWSDVQSKHWYWTGWLVSENRVSVLFYKVRDFIDNLPKKFSQKRAEWKKKKLESAHAPHCNTQVDLIAYLTGAWKKKRQVIYDYTVRFSFQIV